MSVIVAYALISLKTFSLLTVALSLTTLVITTVNIPPRVAATSTPTITLIGFVDAWNFTGVHNPTIVVTKGDTVTMQLSSGDSIPHLFFVDVDKNGPSPDCPGADVCSIQFSTSTTLTFPVNFAPGTYTYYCSIHPMFMLGQFIVLAPPAGSGGGPRPMRA